MYKNIHCHTLLTEKAGNKYPFILIFIFFVIKNCFTVEKYTKHKLYHVNQFQVYSSVVLSTL